MVALIQFAVELQLLALSEVFEVLELISVSCLGLLLGQLDSGAGLWTHLLAVVVNFEWSLRLEEVRVGTVVLVRNLLSVQCISDYLTHHCLLRRWVAVLIVATVGAVKICVLVLGCSFTGVSGCSLVSSKYACLVRNLWCGETVVLLLLLLLESHL